MSRHSVLKRNIETKKGENYLPVSGYRNARSGHATERVSRPQVAGDKERATFVRKQFDRPHLAQIEAAMAAYYRLHQHHLIPKVRTQEDGFHTLSKVFPNFIDLKKYLADSFTAEKKVFLINHGLPEILALSILAEEDDLHGENIGIFGRLGEQLVGRIDFDMSAYSFISRPELRGLREYDLFGTFSESKFILTPEDIDNFPILHKLDPFYWPTKKTATLAAHGYTDAEIQAFRQLADDKDFKHHAYLLFLKAILMPDEAIKDVFSAYIPDSVAIEGHEVSVQSYLQTGFIAKKENLKRTLLQSAKFMRWFEVLNIKDINAIFEEFAEYNQLRYADTEINLNDAAASYHCFVVLA
jgi:hypothetical protein